MLGGGVFFCFDLVLLGFFSFLFYVFSPRRINFLPKVMVFAFFAIMLLLLLQA